MFFGAVIIVLLVICWLILGNLIKTYSVLAPSPRKIISSSLPAELLWQTRVDEPINIFPVVTDNLVVVATDRAIYGLAIATGQKRWEHIPDHRTSLAPTISAMKVIYGSRNGQITTLDMTTGEVIWQRKIREAGISDITSLVATDELVYVATQPTGIGAIELQSGEIKWWVAGADHNIPGRAARLFLGDNELYLFTTGLHVLDPLTGVIKRSVPQNIKPAQLVRNRFYASRWVREAKTLNLINELTSPSYQFLKGSCESFRLPYTFSEDQFYAVGQCGGVYALDIKSNQIIWRYREDIGAQSSTDIYEGNLYVLFDDGEIHAIDLQTGQEQGVLKTNLEIPGSVRNASFLSRGIVANENVLIITFNDENVWAFCEHPCF